MQFTNWQNNPQQGTIPSAPSNSDHLEIAKDNLLDALNYLTFTHHYLESSGLSKQYSQLFTAVSDSLNACSDAIERCSDEPDELYDVAVEHLSPIAGKAQPPESAF
jgi:hypothetical protein